MYNNWLNEKKGLYEAFASDLLSEKNWRLQTRIDVTSRYRAWGLKPASLQSIEL